MNGEAFWTSQSVQSFFEGFNWQGYSLPSLPSESKVQPVSGLCLSVQAFFKEFDWQGLVQKSQNQKSQNQETTQISLLQMGVSHFFEGIIWEGSPEIGMLQPLKAMSQINRDPNQDLKFTDLSDLF